MRDSHFGSNISQQCSVLVVWLQGQYGFLEVEDKEDASDAIREVNGRSFNGGRIKVEYANAYMGAEARPRERRDSGRDRRRDTSSGRRVKKHWVQSMSKYVY